MPLNLPDAWQGPQMLLRSMVLALVTTGCATAPPLKTLSPKESAPVCTVEPYSVSGSRPHVSWTATFVDEKRWGEVDAEVRALAHDLGSKETNVALVLDQLRFSVRILAEDEGCIVSYVGSTPEKYALDCGELAPEREAYRATLEKAVRAHAGQLTRIASELKCKAGPLHKLDEQLEYAARGADFPTTFSTKGFVPGGGASHKWTSGCATDNVEACRRACDRGNIKGCEMIRYSVPAPDAQAEAALDQRICDLAIERKDETRLGICFNLIQKLGKSDRKAGVAVLEKLCASIPTDKSCQYFAFNPRQPLYDPARARRVARAIDACEGPKCNKALWSLHPELPTFDRAIARRAVAWLNERCLAHEYECIDAGRFNEVGKINLEAGRSIAAELEKGCSGTVKFTSTSTAEPAESWRACNALFDLIFEGPLEKPGRALELARASCKPASAGDYPNCVRLAACYALGRCGVARDDAAARKAFAPACDWMIAHNQKREATYDCKVLDGIEPLPFRTGEPR